MKTLRGIGLCLAIGLLSLSACQSQRISAPDAAAFIDAFETRLEFAERRLGECRWEYYTTGASDSLAYYRRAGHDLIANPDLPLRIKRYQNLTQDATLLRKLDLIYRRSIRAVIASQPVIKRLADSLAALHAEQEPTFEGRAYRPEELDRLIRTEGNRKRRGEAYRARLSPAAALAEGAAMLVRVRNQAAVRMGYNSFYDLMLLADGVDREELNGIIDVLDRATTGAYERARDSLRANLGVEKLATWDIDYAYRRTTRQLENIYIASTQPALVRSSFAGIGFKLDATPIYFGQPDESRQGMTTSLIPVKVPHDVRIVSGVEPGMTSLERLFDRVALAMYEVHIDQADYLFAQPPAPCFERAMTQVFTDFMDNDSWMRKYAGLPEPLVVAAVDKLSFYRLYALRRLLAETKFEQRLYQNPYGDLNAVYDEIMGDFLGLDVAAALSPWVLESDIIVRPVDRQNRLLARCITAQIYAYLTDKYGSVMDNQHTREFLVQNMYRFGAADPWAELVRRGTGEALNARYAAAYYGD